MTETMVIGAGSWGTALAMTLARAGQRVQLIAHQQEQVDALIHDGENKRYLRNIPLHQNIHPSTHADMAHCQAIVLATPCSAAETWLKHIKQHSQTPVIAACKGLNPHTIERMDELLIRYLGNERSCILSGPSFAKEVALGKPTAITLAAASLTQAQSLASLFQDGSFRVYTSDDRIGVALGGALKNIIAIAAGILQGLNLGHNALAALVTRGLPEMGRLIVACGGRQETVQGLSGLGDLMLTCTGDLSRNRAFGMALAKGHTAEQAIALL